MAGYVCHGEQASAGCTVPLQSQCIPLMQKGGPAVATVLCCQLEEVVTLPNGVQTLKSLLYNLFQCHISLDGAYLGFAAELRGLQGCTLGRQVAKVVVRGQV